MIRRVLHTDFRMGVRLADTDRDSQRHRHRGKESVHASRDRPSLPRSLRREQAIR
jgi:hypothetical protein